MQGVEATLGQRGSDGVKPLDVGAPPRDGVVGVEAHSFLDRLPEQLDVGIAALAEILRVENAAEGRG